MLKEVDNLVIRGVDAKRRGKYNEALSYYKQAIYLNPYDVELNNGIGKLYFILSDYAASVNSFVEAAIQSSKFIKVELLNKEVNNFDDQQKLNQTRGQIQSLVGNLARHLGVAYAQYHIKTSSDIPELNNVCASLRPYIPYYKESIDPFNRTGKVSLSKKQIEDYERTATFLGLDILRVSAKQHNHSNLLVITNLFLK